MTQYPKKPTATRSTGVFVMASDNGPISSLDAIKGLKMGAGDTLPPGVKNQGWDNVYETLASAFTYCSKIALKNVMLPSCEEPKSST